MEQADLLTVRVCEELGKLGYQVTAVANVEGQAHENYVSEATDVVEIGSCETSIPFIEWFSEYTAGAIKRYKFTGKLFVRVFFDEYSYDGWDIAHLLLYHKAES